MREQYRLNTATRLYREHTQAIKLLKLLVSTSYNLLQCTMSYSHLTRLTVRIVERPMRLLCQHERLVLTLSVPRQ